MNRQRTLLILSTFNGFGHAPQGVGREPSREQAHEQPTYPVQRMDWSGEGEHIVEHRIVDPAPLYSEMFLVSFYVTGQRAKREFPEGVRGPGPSRYAQSLLGTVCVKLLAELGQDFALVKVEETFLLGAYLLDVDLIVAGFEVLSQHLPMPLGVRPTCESLTHHLLRDQGSRLLEVCGGRKLLSKLPGKCLVWPCFVGCTYGFHLVLCPANLGSGVRRFTPTTRRPEEGDDLRIWIYPTVAISYA